MLRNCPSTIFKNLAHAIYPMTFNMPRQHTFNFQISIQNLEIKTTAFLSIPSLIFHINLLLVFLSHFLALLPGSDNIIPTQELTLGIHLELV
jgi:nitrate reductase gamma subunit